MSRILITLALITLTNSVWANQTLNIEGNWRGMVDLYLDDELDESKETDVQLSFNGTEEVIFESFFEEEIRFERNGNDLLQNGEVVGSIVDDRFYVLGAYPNDESCRLEIEMTVGADDKLTYYNALSCEEYTDRMEGVLDRVAEEPADDGADEE